MMINYLKDYLAEANLKQSMPNPKTQLSRFALPLHLLHNISKSLSYLSKLHFFASSISIQKASLTLADFFHRNVDNGQWYN
eukprot:c37119_g1_i1 orf=88-330(+)